MNKNVRKGTVVIYTAITNEFTKIQNEAKNEFGFRSFYNKAPSLFNAHGYGERIQPVCFEYLYRVQSSL